MSDFTQLVPEHIRHLGGYTPGRSPRHVHKESRVNCVKLSSNENPFGPSPHALQAVQAALAECNFYPDNDVRELRFQLARYHKMQPEQVVVAAGSTSLLGILARTLLAPGLNAITSERSFIVYPIATQAAGGRLVQTPARNNGFDLDAVALAVNQDTRLILVANPNNPTGTLLTPADLDRFLERVPENVVVVLDEAYSDFAQSFAAARGAEYSHGLDYVREGRNVVVLRTLSKAHGLAGLRIGYGIGPTELMLILARMRTTFSVSGVAQAAALAALEDEAHIRKALENNLIQSERLIRELGDLGYSVAPTWANFLYCELGEDAALAGKRLEEEGVIVRPLGPWGAPTAIRITIGTREQNAIFLNAFSKVMKRAPMRTPAGG